MIPKSIAPRESKLAGIPRQVSPMNVPSKRERDHQRDDSRGTQVSEEDEEHEGNQNRAFGEVVEYGVKRRIDELGTVVVRNQFTLPWAESNYSRARSAPLTI